MCLENKKVKQAWANIKQRVFNPNDPSYLNYGARGINMSDSWVNDFEAFYGEIGDPPDKSYSIERIDNSLGYVEGNIRWGKSKEQNNNKRNIPIYDWYGEKLTRSQICDRFSISLKRVTKQMNSRHCSLEEAIERILFNDLIQDV